MSPAQKKKILILAGPNGAGKTTFAREFLPKEAACPRFINVDLIAEGLSPFNPEVAAISSGTPHGSRDSNTRTSSGKFRV